MQAFLLFLRPREVCFWRTGAAVKAERSEPDRGCLDGSEDSPYSRRAVEKRAKAAGSALWGLASVRRALGSFLNSSGSLQFGVEPIEFFLRQHVSFAVVQRRGGGQAVLLQHLGQRRNCPRSSVSVLRGTRRTFGTPPIRRLPVARTRRRAYFASSVLGTA